MSDDACDVCGESVSNALARTVRLAVDGAEIDRQRQCPSCFAEWIERYQREMESGRGTIGGTDGDTEIIVD